MKRISRRITILVMVLIFLVSLSFSALLQKNGLSFFYKDDYLYNLRPDAKNFDDALVYANIDGDTIKVVLNGKIETVRLIGVDTTETVHPRKPVEYYGRQASYFTKTLLPPNTWVRLTYDWNPRDKYGRLLAYVWFKCNYGFQEYWILHNLLLILNGYGHAYTVFPFRDDYMKLFREAEAYARKAQIGLWNKTKAQPKEKKEEGALPVPGANTDVQIIDLHYYGCNEYVVIKNVGGSAVDLTGWYLVSVKGSQVYRFPSIVLDPGESISIHSGECASGGYIWTHKYIWNNNGDGAELYDSSGNLIDSYSY